MLFCKELVLLGISDPKEEGQNLADVMFSRSSLAIECAGSGSIAVVCCVFGDNAVNLYLRKALYAEYSVLQKSGAKSGLLENAIDSRMRIKAITYSDLEQKPCQFYWH